MKTLQARKDSMICKVRKLAMAVYLTIIMSYNGFWGWNRPTLAYIPWKLDDDDIKVVNKFDPESCRESH
jgi:hypothetical protein